MQKVLRNRPGFNPPDTYDSGLGGADFDLDDVARGRGRGDAGSDEEDEDEEEDDESEGGRTATHLPASVDR